MDDAVFCRKCGRPRSEAHDENQLMILKTREDEILTRLQDLDFIIDSKRAPLQEELSVNRKMQQEALIASSVWMDDRDVHPGREYLEWVDSIWFTIVCTAVICMNG